MEAQTFHEKNRLQTIEHKVHEVQEKLKTRLPAQYQHVAALVCGAKWRLQTLQPQDAAAVVKKMRLELGAFDYRVKEQAELLTRYLMELDDVLSYGDADIKSARKALILFVQQLLPQADAFKERSAKLKQFGEELLSGFERQSTPSTPSESDYDSDMHVKDLFDESEEEDEENEDESMEPEAEADEEEADEAEAEEEQVEPPQKSPKLQPASSPQTLDIDINSLPVWRPYYQLQRRQDGIYLIARLRDIDPRNVRVQWNEHNGVLRVSGYRLPTQKDIMDVTTERHTDLRPL
ncbi:Hypothetical protein PHPALM_7638 [Phytophthora palmivora]|uniref:BAG domain-containing protein n=1 Tax=Phytophthora palmivora TaxID=4796 RepID=A0A2P4YBW0_9STRA|nr:Hypothetical protein PHPALM_7638 [Phytophthora palmivora]